MKTLRLIFCFVFLLLFSFLTLLSSQAWLNAQTPATEFGYDASGNRISRNTIVLSSPQLAPQPAPNRANAAARNFEEKNNHDSIVEGDFFVDKPEDNEILDIFYTDKLNESDVVIYPNPTRGALAVEIRNKTSETSYLLTVFNFSGSIVFQKSHIGDYTQVDLSAHPKGSYLLRISSQNSVIIWKIVKD